MDVDREDCNLFKIYVNKSIRKIGEREEVRLENVDFILFC